MPLTLVQSSDEKFILIFLFWIQFEPSSMFFKKPTKISYVVRP